MIRPTRTSGKVPLLRLARVVRLVGGIFRAGAAGPPPLPSFPWQLAQYCAYISLPEAGDVSLTLVFLTCGELWPARIAQPNSRTMIAVSREFMWSPVK